MTAQTITEQTISTIVAGRAMAVDFANNLDSLAATYDKLDPAVMSSTDTTAVFQQTAELLRHLRQWSLSPLLEMLNGMESACHMVATVETPRTRLLEAGRN